MTAYALPSGNVQIAFSGGRTSAFMLHQILEANGDLPDRVEVTFQNTGREMPQTLDFISECASRWRVPVTWLEYTPRRDLRPDEMSLVARHFGDGYAARFADWWRPDGAGFRAVSHNSAARHGEPFLALILHSKFLPNQQARFCTTELKVRTAKRYLRSLGWDYWTNAVGLRADEPQRIKPEGVNLGDRWTVWQPLNQAGIGKRDVALWWRQQPFDLRLPNVNGATWLGNCDGCFAAETEIVTDQGIKPIGELVGQTVNLLVPKRLKLGSPLLSEVGSFVAAPIRSFGVQRLWRIVLAGKGRSRKEVFATAQHRWFLAGDHAGETLTTSLKPGNKLRGLHRSPVGEKRGAVSNIGVLRGFAFGDGTRRHGSRPGIQRVYEGKDEPFRPALEAIFGEGRFEKRPGQKGCWIYYGIPDYWKSSFPDLSESRGYLLGWLAGWFSADGCVAADGTCSLHSATREHLEFARSVCATLGIQCWPIGAQTRMVTPPGRDKPVRHTMFKVNINRHQLPPDFFRIKEHRARIETAKKVQVRRYGWTVFSVEPTDRVEEVFCATVDGVAAFGLSDGIMTGNCFLKSEANVAALAREYPERHAWWEDMESLASEITSGTAAQWSKRYSRRELRDFMERQGDMVLSMPGLLCQANDGECIE